MSAALTRPHFSLRSLLTKAPARLRNGVLEFVGEDSDYCGNFGRQWNQFREVQIDAESGQSESHARFFAETGWSREELAGKVLLDAGCGAGRFSDVALEAGAYVVAVDISDATQACRRTLSRHDSDRYLVLRANLFDLPLEPGSFDGIFSLGVLHHTPEPARAIAALAPLLRRGGRFATWFYERRRPDLRFAMPRTWLRRLTRHWSDPAKYRLAQALTTAFFPLGWGLSWCGRAGERVAAFLPYASRHQQGRGDLRRQWTYSVMDTFDWYGPAFDLPQTEDEVHCAMMTAGLTNVRRLPTRGLAVVSETPSRARSLDRNLDSAAASTADAYAARGILRPALSAGA